MNVYEIDDGEQHMFVAVDATDAFDQYIELYGDDAVELDEEPSVRVIDDNKQITINDYDGTGEQETKTAREWADDAVGPSFLCSTVW